MWANSISDPSESVRFASNLPRLSEDSKMLRAGTLEGFRFLKRERKKWRSRSGKELVALSRSLALLFSMISKKEKRNQTHPDAERDLAPGLGQGLGDGPAEALVVGDAGDERLLACKREFRTMEKRARVSFFSLDVKEKRAALVRLLFFFLLRNLFQSLLASKTYRAGRWRGLRCWQPRPRPSGVPQR